MEKIWLKSYPPGVPAEIRYDEYQSIGELVRAAHADGNRRERIFAR